ncbi:DUF4405 domain-containing protein [Thalassobius sp. S69A]|uniref:DUF4405 domain-containing protein n=1 Tax=unclassified Thalassovita TaxID=2619711 RepID=UPI000C11EF8E|nr:hypothetical protein [Paracoccaceae bacterium]MBT24976.1 hypothetical protein [Paracoccaceae bacterium]
MSTLRKYATPLTIGSFLIMAVTGLLMFFHADTQFNKLAHEWLGWLMIGAVALHVVLNWRAFMLYFKRPLAKGVMGVCALLLAASFIPASQQQQARPDFAIIDMVVNAPLNEIAPLLDTDVPTLLQRLNDAGHAATPDQTLSELTFGDTRQAAFLAASLQTGA